MGDRSIMYELTKPEVFLSAFDGTFEKGTNEFVSEPAQQKLVEQLTALKELARRPSDERAVD